MVFKVINEQTEAAPGPAMAGMYSSDGGDPAASDAAQRLIILALKTLSQRALVAISNLFTILMCGSAFWLWYVTLPNPTTYQLIGLGLYGALIIALHLVKRRE